MRKCKKGWQCPNPPESPIQAGVESNHTRRGDSFMPLPLVKPSVVLRFLINSRQVSSEPVISSDNMVAIIVMGDQNT